MTFLACVLALIARSPHFSLVVHNKLSSCLCGSATDFEGIASWMSSSGGKAENLFLVSLLLPSLLVSSLCQVHKSGVVKCGKWHVVTQAVCLFFGGVCIHQTSPIWKLLVLDCCCYWVSVMWLWPHLYSLVTWWMEIVYIGQVVDTPKLLALIR